MEKFIQIQAAGVENQYITQCNCYLFGLTESGKIFMANDADGFNSWCEIGVQLINQTAGH